MIQTQQDFCGAALAELPAGDDEGQDDDDGPEDAA
jgi:hypothetical protein